MKKLYLLRHAKSDWNNPNLADKDRPLNARGIKVSRLLGAYLLKANIRPGLILCSPARRARQTLDGMTQTGGEIGPVRYEEKLYEAGLKDFFDILRHIPDTIHTLMIIGHNPGLETLTHSLIKNGEPKALKRLQQKFPTGALVNLALNIDHWQEISPELAELTGFYTPKEIIDRPT